MNRLKAYILFIILTLYVSVCSLAQSDKDAIYKKAVKAADSIYKSGDLESAKGAYYYASRLLPSNSYPTQQIKKIDAEIEKELVIRVEFEKVFNQAEKLFAGGDKQGAKTKYEEALKIKADPLAKEKLDNVNRILAEEKAILEKYKGQMSAADKALVAGEFYEAVALFKEAQETKKDEKAPAEAIKNIKLRVTEEFGIHDSIVKEGDRMYDNKEFKKALFMYKTALVLMPDNKATLTKYKELDNIVEYYTDLKTSFDMAVSAGDKAMEVRDFKNAELNYEKAIDIFPDEKYPHDQLATAKKLALDIINLDKYFREAIEQGDNLLALGNVEMAIKQYQTAENLKPNQAKGKLANAEKKLNTINTLAEQFNNFVIAADTLFTARKFEEALNIYKSASALRSREIETRVGAGKSIDEELCLIDIKYAQSRIKETEEVIAIANKKYNDKKDAADKAFYSNNLDAAAELYNEALTIRPNDKYSLGQIDNIAAAKRDAIAKAEADQAEYDSAIENGDKFLAESNFRQAFNAFSKALAIKPKETYPAEKLKLAKTELDIIEKRDAEYSLYVKEGDYLFNANNYADAIAKYSQAMILKPDDAYAKSQIELSNKNIAEIERKAEEARQELIRQKEQLYATSMTNGNNYIKEDEYELAKSSFEQALTAKPNDEQAKLKLAEAVRLIEVNPKAMRERYAAIIAEGDNLAAKKQNLQAIDKYREAYAIGVNNENVIGKIDRVSMTMKDSIVRTLSKKSFKLIKNTSIKIDFKPIAKAQLSQTMLLVKADNLNASEGARIVVNFGNGNTLNGGIVINILKEKGSHYYIVNLSTDSNWTGKDHNWITILGENGDINIEEILIIHNNQ